MKNIIACLLFFPFVLNAQIPDWGPMKNLIDKTWEAEGKWGNGSAFKQSVSFSYDLQNQLIVALSKGFINQEQTQFGDRNHGIRSYDAKTKQFKFWEFDTFGGITKGDIIFEGKNILYQYQYGTSFLTDMWQYENDSTYAFIVGTYKGGKWEQKYLEARFKAQDATPSLIEKIKPHLVGKWQSKAWKGIMEESWHFEKDRLVQKGVYSEKGKILYEAQSFIEEKGGALVLTSVIKNSNPKIFKATFVSDKEIVFENTDYKNPSKVTYMLEGDHYHRKIEGIENGAPSEFTFEFTLKK